MAQPVESGRVTLCTVKWSQGGLGFIGTLWVLTRGLGVGDRGGGGGISQSDSSHNNTCCGTMTCGSADSGLSANPNKCAIRLIMICWVRLDTKETCPNYDSYDSFYHTTMVIFKNTGEINRMETQRDVIVFQI